MADEHYDDYKSGDELYNRLVAKKNARIVIYRFRNSHGQQHRAKFEEFQTRLHEINNTENSVEAEADLVVDVLRGASKNTQLRQRYETLFNDVTWFKWNNDNNR